MALGDKTFKDQIYGSIDVKKAEVDLVQTKAFQRLRWLRQLGFVNYVFPCAEHSRFAHSLGVLHIMGRMSHKLKDLGFLSDHDVDRVRLAALLHDIGHFPMSHLTESVYSAIEKQKANIENVAGIEDDPYDKHPLVRFATLKTLRSVNHEELGSLVVENYPEVRELVGDMAPLIGGIITGLTESNYLEHQLMHSSLDCDRLDYLARDSHMTGAIYGRVDVDYLIGALGVGKTHLANYRSADLIGVYAKAQQTLEHYLMARFFHFTRIIGNKTCRAFECLAKAVIYEMIRNHSGWPFKDFSQIKACLGERERSEEFLEFDDINLWRCLREYSKTDQATNHYRTFLQMLRYRIRPKVILDFACLRQTKDHHSAADEEYVKLKFMLENGVDFLMEALEISDPTHIGWQEMSVDIERVDPGTGKSKEDEKDYDQYQIETPRIITRNGEALRLIDEKSSITMDLSQTAYQSLIVYYVEPKADRSELEKRCTNASNLILTRIRSA